MVRSRSRALLAVCTLVLSHLQLHFHSAPHLFSHLALSSPYLYTTASMLLLCDSTSQELAQPCLRFTHTTRREA